MTRREFFARILAALGLGPKHERTWRTVGYGELGPGRDRPAETIVSEAH